LLLSAPWAEDIDRQQAAALSSNGAAARRSAANAVDSRRMRLNTVLFVCLFVSRITPKFTGEFS